MRSLPFIAILFLIPLNSLAIPYWPEYGDGEIYYYESNNLPSYAIRYSRIGEFQTRDYVCDCYGGETYSLVDGVVGLKNCFEYWPTLLSPQEGIFDPPVPVAWEGMKDGDVKLWQDDTSQIIIEVTAEIIETPLGLLDVLRVRLIGFGADYFPISSYYLHVDLGVVKENSRVLVGWDIPVTIENRSWSSVKAMYR